LWKITITLMALNVQSISLATQYPSKELCFDRLEILAELLHVQPVGNHVQVGEQSLGLYAKCEQVDTLSRRDPIRGGQ
jgi:hypothetical protein